MLSLCNIPVPTSIMHAINHNLKYTTFIFTTPINTDKNVKILTCTLCQTKRKRKIKLNVWITVTIYKLCSDRTLKFLVLMKSTSYNIIALFALLPVLVTDD